ncbi:MAG: hypothetical protein SFW36_01910 [Leptolyngbyaceae cyanobacterium bins.59]|nr:hypothetical protein [Leptolyngbyaceae cyanobacterium bins.59]
MPRPSLLQLILPPSLKSYMRTVDTRLHELERLTKRLKVRVKNLEDAIDVLISSPHYQKADEIGFNGQILRKQIFQELITRLDFQVILETGTWTGNTTGYMAEVSGLPVFSTEINPRYHAIAQMRLAKFENITLENLDSRQFLEKMAKNPNLTQLTAFFYLDAHWYEDLPLGEEMSRIAENWDRFVIMVDDFQVPDDSGYTYDHYGPGQTLNLDYIESTLRHYHLVPFYPACPATQETGAKRGCVLITKQGELSNQLAHCSLIKQFQTSE